MMFLLSYIAIIPALISCKPTLQTPARFDGHKLLKVLHNTENDLLKLLAMEVKFEAGVPGLQMIYIVNGGRKIASTASIKLKIRLFGRPLTICDPSRKERTIQELRKIKYLKRDRTQQGSTRDRTLKLDFWKLPRHVNDTTYVRVAPEHIDEFLSSLEDINAHVLTIVDDIQKLVEESPMKIKDSHRRSTFDLYNYHTYASIQSFIRSVSGSPRSGLTVEVFSIGSSIENRMIDGVKVSSNSGTNKRSIIIDGGIHAREWIAPAAVIYTINQLVYNHPSGEFYQDINWLLDHYDVYLIPVLNPDGYEFTDLNRMWRKNRRNNGNGCYGVDLNRNFPFHWNPDVGGSLDPCSDLYSGSSGKSEPETQHMVNFLMSKGSETDAYLTVHSYGQMWLYPWGYTSALPSDWQDLEKVARDSINDVRALYGTEFITGSITRTLYAAAGGSDDFAKGVAGIKYSYTLELRDTGRYGFQLPRSQIRPSCEEFLAGVLAFAKNMHATENNAGK